MSGEHKHEHHSKKHHHHEHGTTLGEYNITIDNGELISAAESECLEKVKEHAVAKGLSDKYLMIFLLARKLDADRTVKLLENHRKFCADNNLDRLLTDEDLPACLDLKDHPFSFWDETTVDKQGRGLIYLYPSRFPKPGEMTVQDNINMAVYFFQRSCHQPLSWHRKGICYVESLEGFSMSSVDTKGQKQVQEIYENNFPMRIQAILVVDPPARWLLKILLKIAKKIMKAKIVGRVQILTKAEVTDFIDHDQLLEDFGGSRHFDKEKWHQYLAINNIV